MPLNGNAELDDAGPSIAGRGEFAATGLSIERAAEKTALHDALER